MAEETQAIIRFVPGWAEDGISEDGLPRFRETVQIIKSVPPYTQVTYEATEQDFADYPAPYQLFQTENAARLRKPGEAGFPLALWPVISPAMFKTLAAREVFTVEQLAKFAGRNDPAMPGEIKEVAERARDLLALSADLGKFEAIIRDLKAQRDVLAAENAELKTTVSSQNALINTLKMRVA